jgi:hypothetical protein
MEPNESLLAAAAAMLSAISKMGIDTPKQTNTTEYSPSGGALTGRGGALTGRGGAFTGRGGALTGRGGALSGNNAYVPRPIKSQDGHHIAVKAKTSWPFLDDGFTDIKSITKYLRFNGFRIGSTGTHALCSILPEKVEGGKVYVVAKIETKPTPDQNGIKFSYNPNINGEIGWENKPDTYLPECSEQIQALIKEGVFSENANEYLVFWVEDIPQEDTYKKYYKYTLFVVQAPNEADTSSGAGSVIEEGMN